MRGVTQTRTDGNSGVSLLIVAKIARYIYAPFLITTHLTADQARHQGFEPHVTRDKSDKDANRIAPYLSVLFSLDNTILLAIARIVLQTSKA